MIVSIERARAVDAEALVRVQIAAFNHDAEIYPEVPIGGPPGYDSICVMLQKIENHESYKIVVGEKCIGGIVVFAQETGHYHLDLIFLDPAYHNQGIGTQAMVFLERTYSATRWTLDTPQWAIRNQHFYEKFGYVKVGEYQAEDGTPLIMCEKHSG